MVTINRHLSAKTQRWLCLYLIFISLFVWPDSVCAQDSLAGKKVGLVLSGGGAKGFAHIGVLKVLEEEGVEISYIGGTSMGAIVGGLYASGYTASQIDSIFRTTDFEELLKDYVPRSSKNFFEKRNDELYAVSLPFHKFRISMPTALSKGTYNYNMLAKLTDHVKHTRDFNKLPIPFLCIATDIETGEEVLLDHGYLPQAMQASSAFPSLFSPVEIGGRLLVDGGVTNNYPIDEVRKLGADIIIGVDVQDDLKTRKGLRDATRILVQISNMGMSDMMKEKARQTDIYIKPDITNFSVISFDQGDTIIRRGEVAALKVIDEIRKYGNSVKKPRYGSHTAGDSLSINKIQISQLDNFTRAYVIGKLRFKPNSRISYNDLKNGIDNLSATQNFSGLSYSFEKNGDHENLLLNLTENKVMTYLKLGLHYDGLYKSGILVNITNKKTLLKNDVASLDIILGDNLRFNFDYYIDNGFYWSFGVKSKYNRFNRNLSIDFNNGELLDLLNVQSLNVDFSDFTSQAYVQTVFAQKFLIGAGLEYKALHIESATIQNTSAVFDKSKYTSAFGYFKYDSLDNKYFPRSGVTLCGDFQSYFYSTDYSNQFQPFSVAKGTFTFARSIGKKVTLKLDQEGGFAIGESTIDFFNFILGGYGFNEMINIRPFYGYDFLSITGDSYIKTGLTLDYEFIRNHHFNLAANYAQVGDHLFDNTNWIGTPMFSGYALGYGLETIIGPAEIKYSWSPEYGRGFTWFSIGFWF
jgi:NTE family protein